MAQNPVGVANVMIDKQFQSPQDLAFMDAAVAMVRPPRPPLPPRMNPG